LQQRITQLEQARDRNGSFTLDVSVPYFVPMALGAAYYRSGQFADAEREYKQALAANAASGETHNNLAVLYLTTGRYDEAESEVRAAEKVGFRVNENLKGDIRKKKAGG
jgi:Tfp pilus assembly protein PilF